MSKYVITYSPTKKGIRRIAMRNGKISYFSKKSIANKRKEEYVGYNPRISRVGKIEKPRK